MLPETLTASQENIPDLTEKQLSFLGFSTNHEWKLNAKMLGYTPHHEYAIDDFVDELIGTKIRTFMKGKQLVTFNITTSSPPLFPVAVEGDTILQQLWQTDSGGWEQVDLFRYDPERKLLTCILVPFGLTGNFSLTYAKTINASSATKKSELSKSLENINEALADMRLRDREMQFIHTNQETLSSPKNGKRIRVRRN